MKKPFCAFAPAACVLLLCRCVPLEDPRPFTPGDLRPPVFLGMMQGDEYSLALLFSEAVSLETEPLACGPEGETIAIAETEEAGAELRLRLEEPPGPGERCTLTLRVADRSGNSLRALVPFYGLNTALPPMLLNEFTTRGSSTSPDMVEILVSAPGNLAGALLCEGVDGDSIQEIVLPPIEAAAGDFVIVHFKPQGIPEEVDETADRAESGGLKSHPGAWDLWVAGGSGLSGNNGVLALYERPGGRCIDGVLYSNRTSASDSDYGGFGSAAVLSRARALVEAGMWEAAEGEVRPEDAVNPDPSTATRSIFRMPHSPDTDSAADWYIAPTSGATFGEENGTEVHVP